MSIVEEAKSAIEAELGTQARPRLGPANYSEGLRLAISQMRAQRRVDGKDICQFVQGVENACATCNIISRYAMHDIRICSLVSEAVSEASHD